MTTVTMWIQSSPASGQRGYRELRSCQPSPGWGRRRVGRVTGVLWEVRVSRARLVQVLTVAAALSLAVGGCAAKNNSSSGGDGGGGGAAAPAQPANAADPKGTGQAKCSGVAIAYAGTINGANAALGQNILNGVQLAVDRHNQN